MMLFPQTPAPPVPPELPHVPNVVISQMPFWAALPPFFAVLIAIAAVAACTVVLLPVARALARRLERGRAPADFYEELEQLRSRVGELEAQQGRVAELEERLDFAERLLTQQRVAPGLPGGGER
jgi:hypothetical protein